MYKPAVNAVSRSLKKAILLLLRGYQLVISPWLGNCCRFYPTCSVYAKTAIEELGPFRGIFLTIGRVLRCQPFHPGGFDPVPIRANKKHGH